MAFLFTHQIKLGLINHRRISRLLKKKGNKDKGGDGQKYLAEFNSYFYEKDLLSKEIHLFSLPELITELIRYPSDIDTTLGD